MEIIKEGRIERRKFNCPYCDTEFIADRRDYKMTNFEICGVPRNIGIPEDVVAAHTTCYSELAVECPICRKVIEVKDGSLL